MKICRSCNSTYESPNIRFCGADGTALTELNSEKVESEPQIVSPVAFRYSRHSGNPFSSSYQWHNFEGKLSTDENWQISFADKSFKKTYRDFSVRLNDKFAAEISRLLPDSEVGDFGEMGGSSNLGIFFSDGAKIHGEAERETARKWEKVLHSILMENQLPA
jgi:hypothetical protein